MHIQRWGMGSLLGVLLRLQSTTYVSVELLAIGLNGTFFNAANIFMQWHETESPGGLIIPSKI